MTVHLDERELATRCRLSPRTVQRWRSTGEGPPHLKLGGRVVYRLEDIEKWEGDCRKTGDDKKSNRRRR